MQEEFREEYRKANDSVHVPEELMERTVKAVRTEDDVFLEICGDGGMCLYCLFWRLETDDG